ncbi:hypothetical protein D3C87_1030240 [compost metagenome]
MIEHTFVLSITRQALARCCSGVAPFSSNETIAPPPLCWRMAMSYCGWDFNAGWYTLATAGCASRNSATVSALCECRSMRMASVSMPLSITHALNADSVGPAVRTNGKTLPMM